MKLSIITINRNNAAGLRKTMESVLSQTYRDFEYIIIDGASMDGSVDVVREYESANLSSPHPLTIISLSEPDTGIYNAMNKGIEIAEGKRVVNSFNRSEFMEDKNKGNKDGYVLMLNSGDYLIDEHVIERVIPELGGTDIIQGNNMEEIDNHVYRNHGYGKSDIDFFDVMKGFFLHQAAFCKKQLFEDYGFFDESYKMAADTKFFMTCLGIHNATFRYIDLDIANYDTNGISAEKFGKWAELRAKEDNRLRHELFSDRQLQFFEENEKKVRLYNQLHAHRWVWTVVMCITHIEQCIYGSKYDLLKKEQIR